MPSEEDKQLVRKRVAAGSTIDDVVAHLNVPVKRVQKLFRRELDEAAADAKHALLSKLYEVGTSGSNMTATIFCAKARYGWRDTGSRESDSPASWPKISLLIAS